jgi:hypothetical protein
VLTNHKYLRYYMSAQKLSHQQARWAEYLSRFRSDRIPTR